MSGLLSEAVGLRRLHIDRQKDFPKVSLLSNMDNESHRSNDYS